METDWLNGLAGGVLIGLGSALLLVMNGRIAGISGIFSGLVSLRMGSDLLWRLLFVGGLMLGGTVAAIAWRSPEISITHSVPLLIAAGLITGFGTRLGNGCTSGHGVCGISRFSARSIVATIVFMVMAALTVFVAKQF